jgi:hypothetical protein
MPAPGFVRNGREERSYDTLLAIINKRGDCLKLVLALWLGSLGAALGG